VRRARSGTGLAVAIAVLALAVAAARLFGQDIPRGATCEQPVAWEEADLHVGQTTAISGPVAATSYVPEVGGEPTFLNLGNAHPAEPRFDVVVYGELRDRFDRPPEELFAEQTVCVIGTVRLRDGVPQIVLRSPASIVVQ
jgi:hypothetical protein